MYDDKDLDYFKTAAMALCLFFNILLSGGEEKGKETTVVHLGLLEALYYHHIHSDRFQLAAIRTTDWFELWRVCLRPDSSGSY